MNKTTFDGKWIRVFDCDSRWDFTINTDKFIIHITGGSVVISDKKTGAKLNQIRGYNYLYTGDVKPDETELFALENGKHFYIISLEDFTQKLKVTLPRFYEAIDVCGSFSSDGEFYMCLCTDGEITATNTVFVNMKRSLIRW